MQGIWIKGQGELGLVLATRLLICLEDRENDLWSIREISKEKHVILGEYGTKERCKKILEDIYLRIQINDIEKIPYFTMPEDNTYIG